MRTLLIDNHDSFTYNLFQLLAEVNGREPLVVHNDEAGWEALERLEFDNVVISPGPGRPEREGDFGVCAEAIARCEAPLLGVCLGHQGIGRHLGARVERMEEPWHGRIGGIEHRGTGLFAGIPSPFDAVRYHSLALAPPLPSVLEATAWCDGVPMAVAHRRRPQWGVQFHPESIATRHGAHLLANFRDLTARRACSSSRGPVVRRRPLRPAAGRSRETPAHGREEEPLRLLSGRLRGPIDGEEAFARLYGGSEWAFWLDGESAGPGARFSYLGDASGPLAARIAYDVGAGEVAVERRGSREAWSESIFAYLSRELARLGPLAPPELPFGLDCGFVGYLGYELKADCGGDRVHASAHPDAAFLFADRVIAIDHDAEAAHLLALCDREGEEAAAEWIEITRERLRSIAAPGAAAADEGRGAVPADDERASLAGADELVPHPVPARSRGRYLADIEACLEHLRAGESYEVCLTNSFSAPCEEDPLDLYRRLRRANPAPYAAYLRLGGRAILSSSPERFLRVDRDGRAEARPIKGTSRRGRGAEEDAMLAERLADDEKNRAENLMITDLLRNDLGSVCEVGSVEVPELMAVESYETVHQLVTTVRGRLRPQADAVACVRACFPPGSMTGAPKRRTMEILDRLEGRARGVYSGAIGYFGLGGACDLAVAIRTIVLAGGELEVGAGGAILARSDPESEHEEMLLKAAAPLRAMARRTGRAPISLTSRERAGMAQPHFVPDLDEQEPWP